MKFSVFLISILSIILLCNLVQAFPLVNTMTKEVIDNSSWNLIRYDGAQAGNFTINATRINENLTRICVYPKTLMRTNDQRWNLLKGNLTKGESRELVKAITLSDLTLTMNGTYVKSACINASNSLADRLQFGSSTIIYEWNNNTFYIYPTSTYTIDPFQISIYECDGRQLTYPNIAWTDGNITNTKINFYAMTNDTTQRNCIKFRTNTFETAHTITQ